MMLPLESDASKHLSELASALEKVEDLRSLEQLRVQLFGRKGVFAGLMQHLATLVGEDKKAFGKWVNGEQQSLRRRFESKKSALESLTVIELEAGSSNRPHLDIHLPARNVSRGGVHPVSWVREWAEEWFLARGFEYREGPEVESDFYNFEALNFAPHHPARDMQDTLYLEEGRLLRTHTSNVQVRVLMEQSLPLAVVATGRVYRADLDATHTPMFHQLEAFMVGENLGWGHLKHLLQCFLSDWFGREVQCRFRPSYFPFTEPSAEVDVLMPHGEWMEILGCGLIHPNVLERAQIDSNRFSGFALGIGLERLAMRRFQIPDLRWLFENDARLTASFVH